MFLYKRNCRMSSPPLILTRKEAEQILHSAMSSVSVSLDLGCTTSSVTVHTDAFHIADHHIPLSALKKVNDHTCYLLQENKLIPIAVYSEETRLYYKLVPTTDWPTITLSSTPMHRHTTTSPYHDTQLKIKEISPVTGRVLDTCCGLGYTVILASEHATHVDTFERDPSVLAIAQLNPYSQPVFASSTIKLHEQDVFSALGEFPAATFDRIIHDPPTFARSPELYSLEFHRELYRVLKPKGILYHYCPHPQKTKGKQLYPRLLRQLRDSGFQSAIYHDFSSGIRAVKQ